MILILNPERIGNSYVKWMSLWYISDWDLYFGQNSHALSDHLYSIVRTHFLKKESKFLIQMITDFSLR